ncbi:YlzJ-like family protein [Halanaerobaculum tunisiense]
MIYSIIPSEELVEEEANSEYKEIEIEGVTMEVKLDDPYSGEVVRIISSNPQDYMNYAPGAKVEFGPTLE